MRLTPNSPFVDLPAIESTTLPLNPRAIGTWTREALLADHQKAQEQIVVLVARHTFPLRNKQYYNV